MISPASGVFFLAFPSGPDLPSPSCLCAIVFHFMFLPSATKLRQGNVFTPVCHSVHKGGSASMHAGIDPLGRHPPGRHPQGDTPLGRPPRADTPPSRRLLQRTVHILLECILVTHNLAENKKARNIGSAKKVTHICRFSYKSHTCIGREGSSSEQI